MAKAASYKVLINGAWTELTFTPSSHTHNYLSLTGGVLKNGEQEAAIYPGYMNFSNSYVMIDMDAANEAIEVSYRDGSGAGQYGAGYINTYSGNTYFELYTEDNYISFHNDNTNTRMYVTPGDAQFKNDSCEILISTVEEGIEIYGKDNDTYSCYGPSFLRLTDPDNQLEYSNGSFKWTMGNNKISASAEESYIEVANIDYKIYSMLSPSGLSFYKNSVIQLSIGYDDQAGYSYISHYFDSDLLIGNSENAAYVTFVEDVSFGTSHDYVISTDGQASFETLNVADTASIFRLNTWTSATGTAQGYGTAGQVLMTDGNSRVYWGTVSGGSGGSGNYLPITGGTLTQGQGQIYFDVYDTANITLEYGNCATTISYCDLSVTNGTIYFDVYPEDGYMMFGTTDENLYITQTSMTMNYTNNHNASIYYDEDSEYFIFGMHDENNNYHSYFTPNSFIFANSSYRMDIDNSSGSIVFMKQNASAATSANTYLYTGYATFIKGYKVIDIDPDKGMFVSSKANDINTAFGVNDLLEPTILNTQGRYICIATDELDGDYNYYYFPNKDGGTLALQPTVTTLLNASTTIYTTATAADKLTSRTISLTSSALAGDRVKVYVHGPSGYPTCQSGIIEFELRTAGTAIVGRGSYMSNLGTQSMIIGAEFIKDSSGTRLIMNVYTLTTATTASKAYVYVDKVELLK